MKIKIDTPVIRRVSYRSLPHGTLVSFNHMAKGGKTVYAMTTFNGTLVNLETGDTWSDMDFDVDVLPVGSKITLIQDHA